MALLSGSPAAAVAANLPELHSQPPLELPEMRMCYRANLCAFAEEISIDIVCREGKIDQLRKRIDHHFTYYDQKACKYCRAFLKNDGLEVRQGPQGYCRFVEEGYSPEHSLSATQPICLKPDELGAACPRTARTELRLDAWTSYSQSSPILGAGSVRAIALPQQ